MVPWMGWVSEGYGAPCEVGRHGKWEQASPRQPHCHTHLSLPLDQNQAHVAFYHLPIPCRLPISGKTVGFYLELFLIFLGTSPST